MFFLFLCISSSYGTNDICLENEIHFLEPLRLAVVLILPDTGLIQ